LLGRISEFDASIIFEELDGCEPFFSSLEEISIVACGSSHYAGMYGKYVIESMAETPVKVELATEYSQYIPIMFNNIEKKLMIAITQSGETADTLVAIKRAKNVGTKILVISNSPGSTASRLADWTILCKSGPEIGVAATKTFTSQLTVLYLIALYLGQLKKTIGAHHASELIKKLKGIPQAIQNVLDQSDEIKRCAKGMNGINSMFFIGRKNNFPIALEGALKVKEISYIHAEGFAAGELKHGPFALLTKDTPVVAIVSKDFTYDKMIANIGEITARGPKVIAIADEGDTDIDKHADFVLRFPSGSGPASCIPIIIILQLLAYNVANLRDCSIDKPRNLAKSVTVE
ncbi:MAG: isomerizing glutamine--fructose-6-phosphate transaminase, partial [Thermoplasmatales archaeon]|nr:isomerizing glutamine--fructose-6-phosphate transaminase [Thermoplasmatales archaeon]